MQLKLIWGSTIEVLTKKTIELMILKGYSAKKNLKIKIYWGNTIDL